MRKRVVVAVIAVSIAALGAVLAFQGREPQAQPAADAIRVGVSSNAELRLLGHVLGDLLESAGMPAEIVPFGSARDLRQAIILREIDVIPSYTGAVWLDVFGWADPETDPATSFERVSAAEERRGLHWLAPTGVNATFAFVVDPERPETAEVDTIEELTFVNTDPEARLCVDPDFAERPDGLAEVARIYGINPAGGVIPTEPRDAVAAVARGDCIAGLTGATDGEAWLAGLRTLAERDPGRVFPAFVVSAVVTIEALEARPGIAEALGPFAHLTTSTLASWNARIVEGEAVEAVATEGTGRLIELDAETAQSG